MPFDPYGDNTPVTTMPDFSDEAQNVPTFPTREAAMNQVAQNDKLSVTLKYDGASTAPWVVLKATSVEEMNELLAEAAKSGLLEAVGKAAGYTKTLGKTEAPPARQNTPTNALQPGQPPASQQGYNQPPTCAHGPMKFASGINRKGDPYKGYYCTLNTQDYQQKCQPVKL